MKQTSSSRNCAVLPEVTVRFRPFAAYRETRQHPRPTSTLRSIYERTIDVAAERERLTKDIAKHEKGIAAAERQLGNEGFLAKAPANMVEGLKKQEAETRLLLEKRDVGACDALPMGNEVEGRIEQKQKTCACVWPKTARNRPRSSASSQRVLSRMRRSARAYNDWQPRRWHHRPVREDMSCECGQCRQHYRTLGIAYGVPTESEIEEAYQESVKQWHPDLYENYASLRAEAEEHFKQIQVAYRELKEHNASGEIRRNCLDAKLFGRATHPRRQLLHQASAAYQDSARAISFGGAPGCLVARISRRSQRDDRRPPGKRSSAHLLAIVDLGGTRRHRQLLSIPTCWPAAESWCAMPATSSHCSGTRTWERSPDRQANGGQIRHLAKPLGEPPAARPKYALEIYRNNGTLFLSLTDQADDSVKRSHLRLSSGQEISSSSWRAKEELWTGRTASIDALLEQALMEDKAAGDTTTNLTIDPDLRATASILARQEMVVCGLGAVPRFLEIFARLDRRAPAQTRFEVVSHPEIFDGVRVHDGQVLAVIRHNARVLLSCERVILNLMQHLSGIATLTRQYVDAIRRHRHARAGHAQDGAGPADAGKIRRAVRRRNQSPARSGQRHSHQEQPHLAGRRRCPRCCRARWNSARRASACRWRCATRRSWKRRSNSARRRFCWTT